MTNDKNVKWGDNETFKNSIQTNANQTFLASMIRLIKITLKKKTFFFFSTFLHKATRRQARKAFT